jgi:hypothetical protein
MTPVLRRDKVNRWLTGAPIFDARRFVGLSLALQ